MKLIGLIGGLSWISTVEYYSRINKEVNERLGGKHSAQILLKSLDHEWMGSLEFNEVNRVLMDEIIKLSNYGVECIVIGNNGIHRALGEIEKILQPQIHIPIFHIADCVGEHAIKMGYTKLLLLGTALTMIGVFYQQRLEEKFNLEVTTPSETDKQEVDRIIQTELLKQEFIPESKKIVREIIDRNPSDAVILGCTELPLLIKQEDYKLPILNTVELHCRKAVNFALDGYSD